MNGVAPALIQDTNMLPGSNEELAKSELTFFPFLFSDFEGRCFGNGGNF